MTFRTSSLKILHGVAASASPISRGVQRKQLVSHRHLSSAVYSNNLIESKASNKVCKAFGIKFSTNPQVVQLARNAGFDTLFIDLEHSWLSLADASSLCNAGLLAGITPFVRVPHQCGNGMVQRVLDGGAMGVIFPHIHNAEDAKAAVKICKYPPRGCRSMTGQLPVFGLKSLPLDKAAEIGNASASTVIAMIESGDAVQNAEEIAAVEGVDVVMIGSSDLSVDLGVGGQFNSKQYRDAVETVSKACKKHDKVFGLGGIYNNPEVQSWAINDLGVRFLLVTLDGSLISTGGVEAVKAVPVVKE